MLKIDFPSFPFRIKEENGKEIIFDPFRKCWTRLSPEEWVRQNILQYLLQVKKYPASLIAIEKQIMLGEMIKRFDILVYNQGHKPWMMIECKAMEVPLDGKVLEQIVRYNMSVPVQYMLITNGIFTFAFERKSDGLVMLEELPVMR